MAKSNQSSATRSPVRPPRIGPIIRPPVAGLTAFAGLPIVSLGGPRGGEIPILDPKPSMQFGTAALNEIERGAIRRFAEALGETNPLYFDEKAARAQGFRDVVAPLLFPLSLRSGMALTPVYPPNRTVLISEQQVEQFEPICAGDQVAVSGRVVETNQRPGNAGPIEFITLEEEGRALDGRVLFRCRRTLIVRAGREQPAPSPNPGA
jgi:acyl dehydratase